MPDFSKKKFQPIKDSGELTIPQEFALQSLKRHAKARNELESRLAQMVSQESSARQFKSKAMPDYDSKQLYIMPSDKPSTVAIQPNFASDALRKKLPAHSSSAAKATDSPK